MRFSLASLFVVMFSASNAASIHMKKRASEEFMQCTSDLIDIGVQASFWDYDIRTGTDIDNNESMRYYTERAKNQCCSITTPPVEGEINYIMNYYVFNVISISTLMETLNGAVKNNNYSANPNLKNYIEELYGFSESVSKCLNTVVPESEVQYIQEGFSMINETITLVRTIFNTPV